ncbi:BatD family protein [Vibrio mytili]|uniref:BatD n=1 Tax=Vibrio mytili TaxID=50718 RepID=A0A0C3DFK4_9VIBR|nr:BatD family protein [Vibrio mytili]KIN10124.1 hypothetical protein SU60_15850 [Vibrio mytili]
MIKKSTTLVMIFVASLLSSASLLAQTLEASVNKTQAVKNEVINLRVSADTELNSDALDFTPLEDDFFLGQPRYGRSSNNINGHTSVRTEWSISIAPMKEGILTIPSFSVNGMRTEPIKLTVSANPSEPNIDDMFSFNMSIDSHTLYPQQAANLRMELLIKADTRRLDSPKIISPSVVGMKLEPITKLQQNQKVIDGLEVTSIEQTFRLTAKEPGEYTLNGPMLTGSYIYGDSLTGSTKVIPISTEVEKMPLTVKPIPKEFKGNWLPASALSMTQSWQDDQGKTLSVKNLNTVKQGTSITRTIQIKARGTQAEYLPRIDLRYPPSLRVYPEQPQFDTAPDGTLIMTVKQVLIPTEVGEVSLPSYTLDWWDSKRDVAKQAALDGMTLKVEPSNAGLITLPEIASAPPAAQNTKDMPSPSGVNELWKTLTFVFAGLWIVTLVVTFSVWKKRPATTHPNAKLVETVGDVDALKSVIKSGDEAKIERAINAYLNRYQQQLDANAVDAVRQELKVMNQARFSPNQQPWDATVLLSCVAKLKRAKPESDQPLEKL